MSCNSAYSFGSTSGSTFAFYLFLLISIFIGVAVYALLSHPRARVFLAVPWTTASRLASPFVAFGVAALVFLAVYFSSLDGFYQLQAGNKEVRLLYILPRRIVILRSNELSEARREQSFKGRWRLILYTPSGQRLASANASYADVKKAWECLAQNGAIKSEDGHSIKSD